MVTEHTSDDAKRRRRSDEERAAALREQLAKIDGKRALAAKALAGKIVEELRVFVKSTGVPDTDAIKADMTGSATRLEQWIARQK